MAPWPEGKLFRGDGMNGEKAHTWFRHLEGRFNDTTTIQAKLYKFAKSLDPGRRAEKWFQALPAADKTDWDLLYAAFTRKWPMPFVVEPSREELLTRLRTMVLKEEDLGVLMGDEDKVYSHVAWADEVRSLTDALEDGEGYLIPDVRRQIPLALRRILPGNLITWTAFLTAVSTISLDRLTDELEAEDRLKFLGLATLAGTDGNTHERVLEERVVKEEVLSKDTQQTPRLVCQFYYLSSAQRSVPCSTSPANHIDMGPPPVSSALNPILAPTPVPSSSQHILSDNATIHTLFNISISRKPPSAPQPDPPHATLRTWADDDDDWEPGQTTLLFNASTTTFHDDVPTIYLATLPQRNLSDLQSTHPWGKIRRRNSRLRQLRPARHPFPTLIPAHFVTRT